MVTNTGRWLSLLFCHWHERSLLAIAVLSGHPVSQPINHSSFCYCYTPEAITDCYSKIGEVLFSLILILSYFLLILPVGILLRKLQKSTSFYTWTHERLPKVGGWTDWRSQESIKTFQQGAKKRPLLLQLAWVVAYFFRRGHYLLLPVLVLLLVLGLILFFIKASALAPFIYTLF